MLLTASILFFIGILIWSKVQNQSMLDTLREIRDFITETFGGKAEDVTSVVKQ